MTTGWHPNFATRRILAAKAERKLAAEALTPVPAPTTNLIDLRIRVSALRIMASYRGWMRY